MEIFTWGSQATSPINLKFTDIKNIDELQTWIDAHKNNYKVIKEDDCQEILVDDYEYSDCYGKPRSCCAIYRDIEFQTDDEPMLTFDSASTPISITKEKNGQYTITITGRELHFSVYIEKYERVNDADLI